MNVLQRKWEREDTVRLLELFMNYEEDPEVRTSPLVPVQGGVAREVPGVDKEGVAAREADDEGPGTCVSKVSSHGEARRWISYSRLRCCHVCDWERLILELGVA